MRTGFTRPLRSRSVTPQPISGLGAVASYTINVQPWRPGQTVPYVVAIVELDEQSGLRLTTNIVGCPVESVHIGQRVRVRFEQHEDVWLPFFPPVAISTATARRRAPPGFPLSRE